MEKKEAAESLMNLAVQKAESREDMEQFLNRARWVVTSASSKAHVTLLSHCNKLPCRCMGHCFPDFKAKFVLCQVSAVVQPVQTDCLT